MKIKFTLLISLFALFFTTDNHAQSTPFNCDYYAYLFQFNDVYSIDLASGNSFLVAADVTPGNINGAGYNAADGYIWGSLKTPTHTIVKIGKDFEVSTYELPTLPFNNAYIGDIAPDGIYYLKNGGTTYAMIDLNPASPTYLTHLGNGTLPQSLTIHDWAFNAVDGKLYTVEKASNKLYRIDISTNAVEDLGEVPIMSGNNYTYGAVYFDLAGNFYVSSNQTGTIYIVNDVANISAGGPISSNLFAFGPSSSSNDGARCPTAPVPVEDCTNGTDDDGDGLVDCDDPSCSGVEACPVIEPTSGGDNGGLESNNRLAEKINKRNYDRIRTGYQFDKTSARRLQRANNYAMSSSNNSFALEDLIPLEIIGEEEAIESTPTDLVAITNATDILSVDYEYNNETIATIMAIKSENGVYEHTKTICDRLLGAELLSVSTIQIREHNFIKSIIKNTEGQMEFTLSFSAYVDTSDAFKLECHWNLDRYESAGEYYNFQIWANSVDKLLALGNEVVNLLEVYKPIESYNLSTPPPVYIKKGRYENGQLHLDVANVNQTEQIWFDAGYKTSETSGLDTMSTVLDLNQNFLSTINIETGQVFDIGFRIGDGIQTPDDVFMSDGPWGVDDFANSTSVNSYSVSQNTSLVSAGEKRIERNVMLSAETSEYVSLYKAFTPRFKAVDITDFNSLSFMAKGTGILDVRFVKKGIVDWNDQYKYSIALNNTLTEHTINFDEFASQIGGTPTFDDVVTLVFTMEANGNLQEKQLNIENIKLKTVFGSLGVADSNQLQSSVLYYNNALHLSSKTKESARIAIVDITGKIVMNDSFTLQPGNNVYRLDKISLPTGLYLVKVSTNSLEYDIIKITTQ
ncbi:DUF6923 family protein [Pseudofulvibacter geojedonensis]|uniref:DUF6923 family protein n=1 Tax=Pseudofulvibacter geojedonensis TaxID=1123758 RepID=A0ABW3I4R5_9FLAO